MGLQRTPFPPTTIDGTSLLLTILPGKKFPPIVWSNQQYCHVPQMTLLSSVMVQAIALAERVLTGEMCCDGHATHHNTNFSISALYNGICTVHATIGANQVIEYNWLSPIILAMIAVRQILSWYSASFYVDSELCTFTIDRNSTYREDNVCT